MSGFEDQNLGTFLYIKINDEYDFKKVSSGIRAKTELGEFLPAAGSIPYSFLRDVDVDYREIFKDVAT